MPRARPPVGPPPGTTPSLAPATTYCLLPAFAWPAHVISDVSLPLPPPLKLDWAFLHPLQHPPVHPSVLTPSHSLTVRRPLCPGDPWSVPSILVPSILGRLCNGY